MKHEAQWHRAPDVFRGRNQMKQALAKANRPSVVSRREIPISDVPESDGLEVRPFEAHSLLSMVVPRSDVALAWTHARAGQAIGMRSHPTHGLLVILDGTGDLIGALKRSVKQGDVITIPRLQEYGFSAIGPDGLHALHVSFADQSEAAQVGTASLAQLLSRNEARMQAALETNPFYLLLRDDGIRRQGRREVMCEALRVFSDAFQGILLTRQATCRDDHFSSVFRTHLLEELGHNELLKVSGRSGADRDAVLRAASAWFCHQMLVLDNSGKAIVNLVLETAGYHFHTLAQAVFVSDESAEYFHVHAEGDELHKDVGLDLIEDLHPENYRRLHRVLEDTWDMFDTMTKRIAHLVALERASA
jgi:quercetin dioxygenase-like cupin family protein